MAITYTIDFKGQAAGSATITSNTLTVATGDFITLVGVYADNSDATAWTVTNTGTAISWTQQAATNTAGNCKVVLWTGTAGATPPTTVSVQTTATGGGNLNGGKALSVMAHTGAHATTPLPAGNIFSGAGSTDVSQSITPTSSGSALWMVAGDWSATNTFAAAANCTLAATAYHDASQLTAVPIRPTTQPRTDSNAFTIGETDTAGKIAWIAFEVQAAPPPAITYTIDHKGQAAGVSATITSNTLTVAAGDFLTVLSSHGNNPNSTAWTVTNTGTAITWTKQAETNTANNCKVVLWTGTAGATPPTTVSVETTAGANFAGTKTLAVMAHTGAHATTPLPAGNIFSGAGSTDVTQSITPTSSGSALWMVAGDWGATNSFAAAANCTLATAAYHEAGEQTVVPIRPTSQPRTDTSAFTIGETDTAGTIAWIAFEVQAAADGSTPIIITPVQSIALY